VCILPIARGDSGKEGEGGENKLITSLSDMDGERISMGGLRGEIRGFQVKGSNWDKCSHLVKKKRKAKKGKVKGGGTHFLIKGRFQNIWTVRWKAKKRKPNRKKEDGRKPKNGYTGTLGYSWSWKRVPKEGKRIGFPLPWGYPREGPAVPGVFCGNARTDKDKGTKIQPDLSKKPMKLEKIKSGGGGVHNIRMMGRERSSGTGEKMRGSGEQTVGGTSLAF